MGAGTVASTNSFVGRSRELAELRGALEDVGHGHERLFLVSGEPGIGKTRLAEEIAVDATSRGMRVAWGRCWEGGGAPAYWPWTQILRTLVLEPSPTRVQLPGVPAEIVQLVPELTSQEERQPTKDPQEARFRLFDATASILRELSRRQPLVLIVDDLHDADQSSLEMLKFVARALPDAHLLIVATYRDAEVQRLPVLASAVAELSREAPQLLLCGLSRPEVAGFVHDRAGVNLGQLVVATIAETTAGNPLFLEGVMRMLIAEGKLADPDTLRAADLKLPDSQRMAIAMRLARLSPSAQGMLPFAAALGIEFDLAPLETVSGIACPSLLGLLDEVIGAGLMRNLAPNRYRFGHALIRAAIYDQIGSAERISIHHEAAEKLEELYQRTSILILRSLPIISPLQRNAAAGVRQLTTRFARPKRLTEHLPMRKRSRFARPRWGSLAIPRNIPANGRICSLSWGASGVFPDDLAPKLPSITSALSTSMRH